MYVHYGFTDASTKRWTFTLPKFDESFSIRFYFERFLRTDVSWYESHTLGWTWQNSIHPHVEFETLWGSHVYVHDGYKCTNEKINSHTTKIWRAFQRSVPFWKIFGNWHRLMWGSYFWLRTTWLYTSHVELETLGVFIVCTWWLQAYQQKDRFSHYQNLTSLSVLGSILKDFWEPTSVNVRVVLLVEDDMTLYIPCRVGNS